MVQDSGNVTFTGFVESGCVETGMELLSLPSLKYFKINKIMIENQEISKVNEKN